MWRPQLDPRPHHLLRLPHPLGPISFRVLPEPLAFGREKRATAGNKLRALLDAEFQEEEIFKEDEDDQEFERQKSDGEEAYLSAPQKVIPMKMQKMKKLEKRQLVAQQKSK